MEYISLKEAQKYCRHSQDYLKLRARQGKLKALKIGRNWVTMREWVEEYGKRPGPPVVALRPGFREEAGPRDPAPRKAGPQRTGSRNPAAGRRGPASREAKRPGLPREAGPQRSSRKPGFIFVLGLGLAAFTAFLFLEPAYFKWAIAGLGHIIPGRVMEF